MKYYEFNADLTVSTEKAYAIGTGYYTSKNGMDVSGRDRGFQYEIVKYIPKSQCIEINGKTFVKGWLVAKNDLWKLVNNEGYTLEEIENNKDNNKIEIGTIIEVGVDDIYKYSEYELELIKTEGLNMTLKIKGYK